MKSKASRNCRRKSVFPTEQRARAVCSLKMTDGVQWPYQCPVCSRWHLTSQAIEGVRPIEAGKAGIFQ